MVQTASQRWGKLSLETRLRTENEPDRFIPIIPATQEAENENGKFKNSLGYIMSQRLAWVAQGDPDSSKN